jgi:hypothetical protein
MALSIDQFKAKLVGGGARANLFKVLLTFPAGVSGDADLASFMIKAASLPATTSNAIDVPFRGRILKVAGPRSFDNWSITVINDVGMELRNTMEQWANFISKQSSNTGKQAPSSYQSDLTVQQLDKDEKVIKTYIIRGAFPTTVSAIDLTSDAESSVEEFTVEFAYQYWTSVESKSTE